MAYFVGMLGRLCPLPGGVGGVEAGMDGVVCWAACLRRGGKVTLPTLR
jgi:hypothetical protein